MHHKRARRRTPSCTQEAGPDTVAVGVGARRWLAILRSLKVTERITTIESFCLALAEAVRLNSAKSLVYTVQGREFLMVERYDRTRDAEERRQRLYQ
jgi:hypothetical protein